MAANETKSRLKNRPQTSEPPAGHLYSMLSSDIELIDKLAKKFDRKGARIRNSEIVRAALIALDRLKEEEWIDIVSRLPKCVGRWGVKKRPTKTSKKAIKK